ncbi:MAG: TATA-box-binding protein [Thermoplasmata archaeon]
METKMYPKQSIEIEVQNIVATVKLADNLNLGKIVLVLEDSEYNSSEFPGLIYRLPEFNTAVLLFKSGMMNCTGAKNEELLEKTVKTVIRKLIEAGIKVDSNPKIAVKNIVALTDLKKVLDLPDLAMALGLENIEYEPEQFPGLIYRIEEKKITFLIFRSGKVVCTGGTNIKEIEEAVELLRENIEKVA